MYVCMYVYVQFVSTSLHLLKVLGYFEFERNTEWPLYVTPSNATFTVSSSINMDSGGKDTAEEKRQSKP